MDAAQKMPPGGTGRLGGEGLRFREEAKARNDAARRKHDDQKRVANHQAQLRKFEDAGHGVSTGRQHEHECAMAERKAKLDAKKAASKAWLSGIAAEYAEEPDDDDDDLLRLAFAHGDATALEDLTGASPRSLTYDDLQRAALRLGALIREQADGCLLYTSPSPRDQRGSRMPSSA